MTTCVPAPRWRGSACAAMHMRASRVANTCTRVITWMRTRTAHGLIGKSIEQQDRRRSVALSRFSASRAAGSGRFLVCPAYASTREASGGESGEGWLASFPRAPLPLSYVETPTGLRLIWPALRRPWRWCRSRGAGQGHLRWCRSRRAGQGHWRWCRSRRAGRGHWRWCRSQGAGHRYLIEAVPQHARHGAGHGSAQ